MKFSNIEIISLHTNHNVIIHANIVGKSNCNPRCSIPYVTITSIMNPTIIKRYIHIFFAIPLKLLYDDIFSFMSNPFLMMNHTYG